MKEQLDRQAVAIEQAEGPKYRRTHKGDELIEDENQQHSAQAAAPVQPVRERTSIVEGEETAAASPPNDARSPPQRPAKIETQRSSDAGVPRRQSSQQFDMTNIWAKTAQSPTSAARPMQMPPRRRSSVKPSADHQDISGTKEDADVDRMLRDDDDDDFPSTDPSKIVWRGKLIQTADSTEPTVHARFVAGRDIAPTVSWPDLLGSSLSIDGRLSVTKAEEYLLSLQHSSTVDISVLALAPEEGNMGTFGTVFEYFKSRDRYAVVNKDKPAMVRDLYIIPLDVGQELPAHVQAMEYASIRKPVEERVLLATFVVTRAPKEEEDMAQQQQTMQGAGAGANGNGSSSWNGSHLPVHMRAGAPGPAGSPITTGGGTFSPTTGPPQQQMPPYNSSGMPPNPYTQQPQPDAYQPFPPHQQQLPPNTNPLVNEILAGLQHAPSAQAILAAKPDASRQQLEHLRQILEEEPGTRTDLEALGRRLRSE